MKRFAQLYTELDQSTKTNHKVAALERYFAAADPRDAVWALYFLCGRKPRQVVPTRKLAQWSAELAEVPDWLFDECYDAVGDLAETVTLLLPPATQEATGTLADWVEGRLLPLRGQPVEAQRDAVIASWKELNPQERFVWNKLLTGGFRVGVSQALVMRALSQLSGQPTNVVAHKLMGDWEPTAEFYVALISPDDASLSATRPYPFCLAFAFEDEIGSLGDIEDWLAEWKWDGIRAQIIRRGGQTLIWSRGEELIGERFPELLPFARALPEGTVLDGEILGWKDHAALPFAQLQRRIGRKTVGKKLLTEVPVAFIAFDLLELAGRDARTLSLSERRLQLEELLAPYHGGPLKVSERVVATTWEDLVAQRERSRERGVEGLMLKRLTSAYGTGRARGDWWKWKIAPMTVDAVLVYAQRGHGKRASLYTDYTFAVWHNDELVPFAKAYSGLTDAEIRQVDHFVRNHTLERFGPVRSVKAELVFELAFENIQRSTRHKSGLAVRFPRMLRWRQDKLPSQADTLESILAHLP